MNEIREPLDPSTVSWCRSCRAPVAFLLQPSGKRPPYDVDVSAPTPVLKLDEHGRPVPHFSTCPDAARWRGRARR